MAEVALIAMPWALASMPSVQLATLKANIGPSHNCACVHWYLRVAHHYGLPNYFAFTRGRLEDGEQLYACLLFDEVREKLLGDSAFWKRVQKLFGDRVLSPIEMLDEFDSLNRRIVNSFDWSRVDVVGFTLNFSQTLGSLYAARAIKKSHPQVSTIVGGAEATDQLGRSLIDTFSEFDFACNGEGELVLSGLANRISNGFIDDLEGLTSKVNGDSIVRPRSQFSSMESLSPPDFDDYFNELEEIGLDPHSIEVVIPVETSRGCYYNCTFCALNIQWDEGIRARGENTVAEIITESTSEWKIHDVFFVDNIIPPNGTRLFQTIAATNINLRFFFEIRANTPIATLYWMKKAGCRRVQIGIEALSTSLLKKMNKKAKTIHNLQCMKICEILGIATSSNLILGHPNSDEEDLKESLKNLEFALAYRPPTEFSGFDMQYGSPEYEVAVEGGGILGNDEKYRDIYPDDVFDKLFLPSKSFSNADQPQWECLARSVAAWEKKYLAAKSRGEPMLTYLVGENHLRIEDRRFGNRLVFVLVAFERSIYLFCRVIRHRNQIARQFPTVPPVEIDTILSELEKSKVMFSESEYFLSLAMPDDSYVDEFFDGLIEDNCVAQPATPLIEVSI